MDRLESVIGADTRLHAHSLLAARAAVFVTLVVTLGLFVAGLLVYWEHLQTVCIGSSSEGCEITSEFQRALERQGLSIDFYAIFSVSMDALLALSF
jgi:hypothetical protein